MKSRPWSVDLTKPIPEPAQEPVTAAFLRRAEQQPNQMAVVQGTQSWTYLELRECAQGLAHALRAQGLGAGDVVAIYGPRSFGFVAGMMAVLLNGSVLLLVDPNLPEQRQRLLLEESRAATILAVTEEGRAGIAPSVASGLMVLSADANTARCDCDLGNRVGEASLFVNISQDDPAYIFFTSGTMGKPKGILGCHKGLSHFIAWQQKEFGIGSGDRVAQLTAVSFDPILRDVFLPLTSGAALCLPTEEDLAGGEEVLTWLERQQITVLHTGPSLAQHWLAYLQEPLRDCSLRWVFFSGEPLTGALVCRWRSCVPAGQIVNLYGPTETTMAKCFYRVPKEVLPGPLPIGNPLPDTQALILTEDCRVNGPEEEGEIVLRTPFRTLGYLNASARDRARFARNPFRDDDRDLLYYTGDRGRYRQDGQLEILGRLDDMVKIRGVAVEPTEVQAVLTRHSEVRECHVAPRTDGGQVCLVAYVVPRDGSGVTPETLTSHLVRWLPPAMVPSAYIFLDRIPLSANGKVDRQALPAPATVQISPDEGPDSRLGALESRLAAILAEVLGLQRFPPHGNFFELGGNSLQAARSAYRIRKVFGISLPVRSILENPTLTSLASSIAAAGLSGEWPGGGDGSMPDGERTHGARPLSFAPSRSRSLCHKAVGAHLEGTPNRDATRAARTGAETELSRIWREILGLGKVGVLDDFFESGGNSLLALQVIARVRDSLNVDLTVRHLFEHPTVSALARILETAPMAETGRVSRRKTQLDHGPLSMAQEQLWFLDQLDAGGTTYNVAVEVALRGSLDSGALKHALDAIVRRHEPLRTVFRSVGDVPLQVAIAKTEAILGVVDLREHPGEERQTEARRIVERESRCHFDLSRDLMLRATLVRLSPEEHILLLVFHHIAVDTWALRVLFRELGECYTAHLQGRAPAWPELPMRYIDYSLWQREWLASEEAGKSLAYWKKQLEGVPPLQLPALKQRPTIRSQHGAWEQFALSPDLSASLREFSRAEGISLFMLLLAAFQVLLGRYSDQEDYCIGSPAAGRTWIETEGIVGFFANSLPLRADLAGEPSFRELLARVRNTVLEAQEHQSLPFEKMVSALRPERTLRHTPLFQVLFVLDLHIGDSLVAPGLEAQIHGVDTGTAKFDLSLSLEDGAEEIAGRLEYSTDLFDAETARRMLGHYRTLLEAAVRDPGQPITKLPMLTVEERRQLLEEWNETKREYPQVCVHQLFEAQAERTPDALALTFAGRRVSYRKLNRQANRLAFGLRSLGVEPDTAVGICLERSVEMVAAILGVHKAGGACVPLDPSYPAERLRHMIEDCGLALIVTHRNLKPLLPKTPTRIVAIDDLPETPGEARDPLRLPMPCNLAYILYTSGSTGRPKGVAMEHRALSNLVHWQLTDSGMTGAAAVVLQFASFTFDVFFQEVFSTLASGGTLVLIPADVQRDPEALLRIIVEMKVERLFVPLIALRYLAEAVEHYDMVPAALTDIVAAGEQLQVSGSIVKLFERLPLCRLHNHYGPTETHVMTAASLCGDLALWPTLPPIGRPISNARCYVLDRHLQPVPVGVPGELYLAGDGLARGYHNHPQLTGERFIRHSFGGATVERLYRTGDTARYLPDGNLEFLGRSDEQTKIRGFRVELGEVEAALAEHPAVEAAAVAVRANKAGDKRLFAYVVPKRNHRLIDDNLRNFLRDRLPAHMLPAGFVHMTALPVPPSGKLNRSQLPDLESAPATVIDDFVPPRTELEIRLARVWAEILEVEPIGLTSQFFSLGGDSLLAVRALVRVRQEFGIDLPVRTLYQNSTLAEFAAQMEGPSRPLPQENLQPSGNLALRETRASFSEERLWFLDRLIPGSPLYHVPVPFRLAGNLNCPALQFCLNEIAARHETLRTTYRNADGVPLRSVLPARPVPIRVVDVQKSPAESRESEARRILDRECRLPFDLSRDLPLRAVLAKLSDTDHILLLLIHHIAFDGWSIGVLVREMEECYRAQLEGRAPTLPELPLQYSDYVTAQREMIESGGMKSQLSYWERRLAGLSPLGLATDRRRPGEQSYRGAGERVAFPAHLTASLRELSRSERTTLFTVLLVAFQTLLYRYTAQTDIAVGTPSANRNFLDTQKLIGLFVNTLVLRADFSAKPTFREVLRTSKQALLEALGHQDAPFEKVVEVLRPERTLSHSPLIQVLFAWQSTLFQPMTLPGLEVRRERFDTGTAKLDLTMSLEDAGTRIEGIVEYNTDLFDAETIRRLIGHYEALLEAAVANPDQSVSTLPLLSEAERRMLLVEWNDTRLEYPQKRVQELFEAQAAKRRDAVALVFGESSLTYGELNQRANILAHRLRGLGLRPEARIGICMNRCPAMIIGLLAVLKAGAAYVPLDPEYPEDRLALIADDSGLEIMLSTVEPPPMLAERVSHTVRLDESTESLAGADPGNLSSEGSPDSLAYIMYTSGSTGTPKGVEVVHRGIARLLFGVDYVDLSENEVILQFAPFTFDASTFEIWGPLLHGGRCVLVPGSLPALHDLRDFIASHQISTMWLTSAYFNLVMDEIPEALRPVRQLLIGGEALSAEHVRRALRLLPATRLINGYGPTESTTFACCYPIPKELTDDIASIPIGRPIGNTQVYILDTVGQPVPVGVPGELHIGGDGLARGYGNRPELTNERFVTNPFSDAPGSRLYRTGDRARYLPSGDIEFLGRFDSQVKIRGFRVEPGEIEAALLTHPQVKAAGVVVRERVPGQKQLVAYVVARTAPAPLLAGDLREFLRRKLPEYMVPARFVFDDSLPFTSSGKLNRLALPTEDPDAEAMAESPEYLDDLERRLAGIWENVLGTQPVGPHASFFDLGGTSLDAVRMFSQVKSALSLTLPISTLFKAPTVRRLAEVIRRRESLEDWPVVVPMQAYGSRPRFFCVHPVGEDVMRYERLARHLGSDQPFFGIQALGLDGKRSPLLTVEDMAACYVEEIRAIQPSGPYFIGGFSSGGVIALEMARQFDAAGEKVALLALLDCHLPSRFSGRLGFHIRNLGRVTAKEVPGYVWGRMKAVWYVSAMHARQIVNKVLRRRSSDVPAALQSVYDATILAFRWYTPREYRGSAVLFLTENRWLTVQERSRQWSRMVKGRVTVRPVPGDHYSFIQEPLVRTLAAELQAAIDEALQAASSEARDVSWQQEQPSLALKA